MINKKIITNPGRFDLKALTFQENFHGFINFVGPQGSGKSISMLNTALALLKNDPTKVRVYTNIMVADSRFERLNDSDMFDKLQSEETRDAIFLLDEIHLYFYSGGKNDRELIFPFSQLRKRNIIVLGTSQIWFHLDKKIRDQALFLVYCRPVFFGVAFKNSYIRPQDYEVTPEGFIQIKNVTFSSYFFRQRYLFELYNSYETVKLK